MEKKKPVLKSFIFHFGVCDIVTDNVMLCYVITDFTGHNFFQFRSLTKVERLKHFIRYVTRFGTDRQV